MSIVPMYPFSVYLHLPLVWSVFFTISELIIDIILLLILTYSIP